MPSLKLDSFGGGLPSWDEGLLPHGQAAYAKNGYLFSGALLGWRKPKILRTLTNSTAQMVYRIPTVTGAQARAFLVFLLNPSDWDVVVIGEVAYTFRLVIDKNTNPNSVLISSSGGTGTGYNLVAALTGDLGEFTNRGTLYSEGTSTNNLIRWYGTGVEPAVGLVAPWCSTASISSGFYAYVCVGAVEFGASYNSQRVVESTDNARLIWLYDLLDISHETDYLTGGANVTFDREITATSTWMEFDDPDTTVVKSPIAEDMYDRYYTASPGKPPEYNTRERIVAGQPFWTLGVPLPSSPPTVSVAGGGNNIAIGYPYPGTVENTGNGNTVFLVPVTPTGATLLRSVLFTPKNTDPDARYVPVLYADDDNGHPGDLLNVGQLATGTIGGVIQGSTFTNPTGLSSDTVYWIGIFMDTPIPFFHVKPTDSENNGVSFAATFSNGPPEYAPPGGLVSDQHTFAFYGDCNSDDVLESRAYTYTWVTAYGEEGPPAEPTILHGWSNAFWTLGLWRPVSYHMGIYKNITKLNIYRTVPGAAGKTVFFYVDTIPVTQETYFDDKPNDEVALNDQLMTTNWYPPPANLQGLVSMPNGMLAGFAGQEVWFCEPFRPHAWPPGYVLTVDSPIVGLGITGTSLVVCTASMPYVMNGISPSQMTQHKCPVANPCISRGSIVSDDAAVFYMSPNGLIQVTAQGQAINTTDLWVSREKWQQFTPQTHPRAVHLASCYYCLGSASPEAQRGFTIELAADNTSFTIWPQPGGHRLGFEFLDSPTGADIHNVLIDNWTGIGMVISDGKVWYFDFFDDNPEYQVYTWRSKLYGQNVKRSYSAIKPFFSVPATTPVLNPTRIEEEASNPIWTTLGNDRYAYIKTFVDIDGTGEMHLIDAREIRKPGEALRIISGFKADTWQWEITGRVYITDVEIATSIKELAGV